MLLDNLYTKKARNIFASFEYTFVEILFLVGIFLLCYNPSQYHHKIAISDFHGPHINLEDEILKATNNPPDSDTKENENQVSNVDQTPATDKPTIENVAPETTSTAEPAAETPDDTNNPEVKSSRNTRLNQNTAKPAAKPSTSAKSAASTAIPASTTKSTANTSSSTTNTPAAPGVSTSTASSSSNSNTSSSTPTTSTGTIQTTPTFKDNKFGITSGTDLIYENQTDLDNFFKNVKDIGGTWVRWDVDWAYVQPYDITTYNWDGIDKVVNTAKKYGINLLGIIDYSPHWAQAKICPSDKNCAPADPNTYAHFAGVLAARYKGSIDNWEIWNEPNIEGFWYPKANVQGYVDLLEPSYTEIKKNNPNANVITAGLAPSADTSTDIAPVNYIKSYYSLGAQNYFDAIGFHPYSYPVAPSYVAVWNAWQQADTIRQIMVSNGDSNKKIWFTEYGAPTGGPGVMHELNDLEYNYGYDFMSENAQDAMAANVISFYKQAPSWVGPVFWHTLYDREPDKSTPENYFGLLRFDGSKKPAYITLKNAYNP